MVKRAIHYRNTRLYVNAGMSVAECVARRDGPLDCEAPENMSTGPVERVTCKRCAALLRKEDGFYGQIAAKLTI